MGIVSSICRPSKPSKQVPVVVIFSGKRKSGKDYCTERLKSELGPETAEIGRLSAPLKLAYAKEHDLDYKQLLSDGPYKEKYRKDMIRWGEERRTKDPGFFAKLVVAGCTRPVLIISDARRITDIEFFKDPAKGFNPITVRVEATEETRKTRGWVFTDGVDNVESECGLDGRNWDHVIQNNPGAKVPLTDALKILASSIRGRLED